MSKIESVKLLNYEVFVNFFGAGDPVESQPFTSGYPPSKQHHGKQVLPGYSRHGRGLVPGFYAACICKSGFKD